MPATYVTEQELRDNLGIQDLYPDSVIEECCQSAQDILNQFLWFDSAPVVGTALQNNVATVMIANPAIFNTGQSVTLAGCGATYNGTYTITGTIPWTAGTTTSLPSIAFDRNLWNWPNGYSFIQFAKVAANLNFTRVLPYGSATGADTKTNSYATTPAVREAAMILAVDIFQARQVSQTGGVTIDGFSPSPYRMGNSMIGKIRGLIAGYTNPAAMVGQMPTPITTLRATIATALANINVWNTYDFPPPTITANSVIVAPADSYLTPSNNTNLNISPLANLKIILTVPMLDNRGNLNGIETLACAVFKKLATSNIVMNIGSMSAPSVLSVQSGDLLTASFDISVLTSWE